MDRFEEVSKRFASMEYSYLEGWRGDACELKELMPVVVEFLRRSKDDSPARVGCIRLVNRLLELSGEKIQVGLYAGRLAEFEMALEMVRTGKSLAYAKSGCWQVTQTAEEGADRALDLIREFEYFLGPERALVDAFLEYPGFYDQWTLAVVMGRGGANSVFMKVCEENDQGKLESEVAEVVA